MAAGKVGRGWPASRSGWLGRIDLTRVDLLALLASLGLAVAVRLPGLAVFLTADEARSWFGRSIIFLDALARADWANTAPGSAVPYLENVSLSPAPGVTTMWTGSLGILLAYWRQGSPGALVDFLQAMPFDPLDPAMLPWLRLPGVLVAVAAVGLTYLWCRPLLGRGGAFLAAGLLALDPFSLALSRVLGHDGLVATFMWLSLLAFLRGAQAGAGESGPDEQGLKIGPSSTRYASPRRLAFVLLSGALAGLAFLSKYPALFLGAFIGLAALFLYLRQVWAGPKGLVMACLWTAFKGWALTMALWTLAAGLVFALLWPAMWLNPLGPVMTILNDALRASGGAHPKGSFFLGQPVPDPGLLFYPLVALLRTTPVVLAGLLLSLLNLSRWVKESRPHAPGPEATSRSLYPALILWAYVILYTLLVTYGGKKQDRYLLPIFPALIVLATLGYLQLSAYLARLFASPPPAGNSDRSPRTTPPSRLTSHVSRLTPHISRLTFHVSRFTFSARVSQHLTATVREWAGVGRYRASFLLPLLLVLQAAFVLPAYPYYFSYYNPLAGGAPVAARTVQVGWGEGLDRAAAYLNTLPGASSSRAVAWYSTTFEPYFKGRTIYKIDEEKISRSPKPGLAADYVIFYINQLQRGLPSEGALAYFRQGSPLHTVTLGGQPYAWIYPAPGVSHVIAGEARLIGQAELLGFDLLDAAGRRLEQVPSGGVATLRLYWEWQGQQPDEPTRVSLTDPAGETWGWAHPLDSGCPAEVGGRCRREGAIGVSNYALAVQPGTPPGAYFLQAWIDRPATGEVVGRFPLAPADAPVTVGPPDSPARPEDFEIDQPLALDFGPLRLLGYNLPAEPWPPGQSRRLELFWERAVPAGSAPLSQLPETVTLTLVPLDPFAVSPGPTWSHAITPGYPPARWQPGDRFRDLWTLDLPRAVARGYYELQVTASGVARTIGRVEVSGRERLFEPPPIAAPLAATLGDSIRLLGYDLTTDLHSPTAGLRLTLYWQALATPPVDYTVFVQVLDAGEQVVAQQDQAPQAGGAPTGTWLAGEVVPDGYTLSFPPPPAGQPYRLIAGMYDPQTGRRLAITTRSGQADALTLATLAPGE